MPTYRNSDTQYRYWPGIADSDGRTLALGPGETVYLDTPVEAAFLVEVSPPSVSSKKKSVTSPYPEEPTSEIPSTSGDDNAVTEES